MGVILSVAGYEELTAEVTHWQPSAEGLLFLTHVQGERNPHADPHVRGAFAGLSLVHDRGALLRAVLELTAVEEGATYGAALLGGVAAGIFAGAEENGCACVRARDRIEPNPDRQEAYERDHSRFRALYPALRALERR